MRISHVKHITLDEEVPVYCMTTETSNFALENAVVVHNCGGLRKVRQRHQGLLPLRGKIVNCFGSGTQVKLSDGSVREIQELVTEWSGLGFSVDSNEVSIDRISASFVTKEVHELLELTFSDGSTVRCTADHEFLTTIGYVEAQELTPEHTLVTTSTP